MFTVTKYSKKGKSKLLKLCINGFEIYHEKVKPSGFSFSSLIPDSLIKGKKKTRLIQNIVECDRLLNGRNR